MGQWTHRLFIFSPVSRVSNANQMAVDSNERGEDDRNTFEALHRIGAANYSVSNTAATDRSLSRYLDRMNTVAGVVWYQLNLDSQLVATNSPTATPGRNVFTFDDAVADIAG